MPISLSKSLSSGVHCNFIFLTCFKVMMIALAISHIWLIFVGVFCRSYFPGTRLCSAKATPTSCNTQSSLRSQHHTRLVAWIGRVCTHNVIDILHINTDMILFTIPTSSVSFIFLLLICASYLAISTRLRFTPPGIKSHNRQSAAPDFRQSRTFFIVAALLLVFWLPAFVVNAIRVSLHFPDRAVHCDANSMINPFVYSFRMRIFKDALRSCWMKRRQNIAIKPVRASWLVWGGGGVFFSANGPHGQLSIHCFQLLQKCWC